VKDYAARPGETNAQFIFTLLNPSLADVMINEVRASCDCTMATLPSIPWVLAPGTEGPIHVTVDLRGKHGQITKQVYVYGVSVIKTLTVKIDILEAPAIAEKR